MKPEVDAEDTVVRLGCGAVVGLFVGLVLLVGFGTQFLRSRWAMGVLVLLSVVVCADLAWKMGDRFFHSMHNWIRWL